MAAHFDHRIAPPRFKPGTPTVHDVHFQKILRGVSPSPGGPDTRRERAG